MAHTGVGEVVPPSTNIISRDSKDRVQVIMDHLSNRRFLYVKGYGFRTIDFETWMMMNSVNPEVQSRGIMKLVELGVQIVEEENEQPE